MKFDGGQQMVGKSTPLGSAEPSMARIKGVIRLFADEELAVHKEKEFTGFLARSHRDHFLLSVIRILQRQPTQFSFVC